MQSPCGSTFLVEPLEGNTPGPALRRGGCGPPRGPGLRPPVHLLFCPLCKDIAQEGKRVRPWLGACSLTDTAVLPVGGGFRSGGSSSWCPPRGADGLSGLRLLQGFPPCLGTCAEDPRAWGAAVLVAHEGLPYAPAEGHRWHVTSAHVCRLRCEALSPPWSVFLGDSPLSQAWPGGWERPRRGLGARPVAQVSVQGERRPNCSLPQPVPGRPCCQGRRGSARRQLDSCPLRNRHLMMSASVSATRV